MKHILFTVVWLLLAITGAEAQNILPASGRCNSEVEWSFDGRTLLIKPSSSQSDAVVNMPDYDVRQNPAPWVKRNLFVQKVKIANGISSIGACAFANCKNLEAVEFENNMFINSIGWGAFLNCEKLFTFSMPVLVQKIGKIAFANNSSLRSVTIPPQAFVDDNAFMSCTNLNVIDVASNVQLGKHVFATEVKDQSGVTYSLYDGKINRLPPYVTVDNCQEYGLSKRSVESYQGSGQKRNNDIDMPMSEVDIDIPVGNATRTNTYALIIGNEDYRFASNVPYARHDASVFAEYCKLTLGVPAENIHLCHDATKYMILEQELEQWLQKEVTNRGVKSLIVYYAGHGAPDIKNRNKSYLLPVDVYGTRPTHGIALDDFYNKVGQLGFKNVSMFIDACFSGVNRDNESVSEGLRAVEVEAEECVPKNGNMVVFSAAQGNETAQGYNQQGHGLFTYYLLKEMRDNLGEITFGQLADNIQKQVQSTAPQLNLRKPQNPSVNVSSSMTNTWELLPL